MDFTCKIWTLLLGLFYKRKGEMHGGSLTGLQGSQLHNSTLKYLQNVLKAQLSVTCTYFNEPAIKSNVLQKEKNRSARNSVSHMMPMWKITRSCLQKNIDKSSWKKLQLTSGSIIHPEIKIKSNYTPIIKQCCCLMLDLMWYASPERWPVIQTSFHPSALSLFFHLLAPQGCAHACRPHNQPFWYSNHHRTASMAHVQLMTWIHQETAGTKMKTASQSSRLCKSGDYIAPCEA